MGNPFSVKRTMTLRQHLDTPSSAHVDIVDSLLVTSDNKPKQCWLVTAARRGDGTTTTAIGLARTLSAHNKRTVLVDANFSDPSLSRESCDPSHPGLFQLLKGESSLESALLQGDSNGGFHILPAGSDKPDPILLLDNDRVHACMDMLSNTFDFVIIDAPPFDSTLDTQLLAPHADGCILVVRADKTGKQLLLKTKQQIEKAGGNLLGLIFNREQPWAHNLAKRWL